jgi:hypothetical protein
LPIPRPPEPGPGSTERSDLNPPAVARSFTVSPIAARDHSRAHLEVSKHSIEAIGQEIVAHEQLDDSIHQGGIAQASSLLDHAGHEGCDEGTDVVDRAHGSRLHGIIGDPRETLRDPSV